MIRPFRPDDAEAVGAMAQELMAAMRALGDRNEGRFDAACFRRDGFGERPAFAGLIAEEGGQAQGYLLYNEIYDTDLAQRVLSMINKNCGGAFPRMTYARSFAPRSPKRDSVKA